MSEFINADCMDHLKNYPDNHFDLAIVDPVYGEVTKGGYMTHNKGQRIGTGKADQKGYHAGLWSQQKTGAAYFEELIRVSKNQIVWGETTLHTTLHQVKVGSCGTNNTQPKEVSRIANSHGLHLTAQHGFSALCGMGCYRAT